MLLFMVIISVVMVIGITMMFLLATKKAYKIEHKIDPVPTQSVEDREPK
ncbi:YtzI protein [Paenisporosarcina quisquiliarum]|jgi:hypothetical protein|uniref:YtzI protein n=1 Tax=Paenisporosarcina quisquiliarum TaxID=365346 RepID=A0A9X3LFK1_9BACL|nr:YtzI protein [Paenisporosarcina quisquiliarum]MCZ8536374.1 YtzI protein [Paenisporosarcina quisquiliarum]